MTLTIDIWFLLPLGISLFGLGIGLYERGQIKGLEEAEKMYDPLMKSLTNSIKSEEKR